MKPIVSGLTQGLALVFGGFLVVGGIERLVADPLPLLLIVYATWVGWALGSRLLVRTRAEG